MISRKLAQRYNEFQNDFGQSTTKNYEPIIEDVFSSDLRKIANGVELVERKSFLLPQLQTAKEISGGWLLNSINIIPSIDHDKCVIHYSISTKKIGIF